MSNNNNRVLSRMGARELDPNEIKCIAGGDQPPTLLSATRSGPSNGPGDIHPDT